MEKKREERENVGEEETKLFSVGRRGGLEGRGTRKREEIKVFDESRCTNSLC